MTNIVPLRPGRPTLVERDTLDVGQIMAVETGDSPGEFKKDII